MKKIILSFSRGKDSLALWLYLKELNEYEIIPVYYYIYPKLDFQDKYIAYIEDVFKTKINIYPSERYISYIMGGNFLSPRGYEFQSWLPIYNYSKDEWDHYLLNKYNAEFVAVGMKKSDSIRRRMMKETAIKKYPINDLKDSDVIDIIKKHNIKLPIDYIVWGSSLDGYTAKWTIPFKEKLPEEFEKAKIYMPLLEVDIKRYENIKDKLPNYARNNYRLTKYKDMILE